MDDGGSAGVVEVKQTRLTARGTIFDRITFYLQELPLESVS